MVKKILIILSILFYSNAFSQIDVKEFAGLLVHDQGRVKPLDTLARSLLLRFNAKASYKSKTNTLSAITWFARLVFEPESTREDRIFKVNHPEVLTALGITSKEKRFSFNDFTSSFGIMEQIAQGIWEKEKRIKERTGQDPRRNPFEREFLRLYQNLNDYYTYGLSFQFAYPVSLFGIASSPIKAKLKLDEDRNQFSYLELMEKVEILKSVIAPLEDKTQSELTELQKEWGELAAKYVTYPRPFSQHPLLILPSFSHAEALWLSPWQVLAFENSVNLVKSELKAIKHMAQGYRLDHQDEFDQGVRAFKSQVHKRLKGHYQLKKPPTELVYNQIDPFYRAKISYGLSLLLVLSSLVLWSQKIEERVRRKRASQWLAKGSGFFWA